MTFPQVTSRVASSSRRSRTAVFNEVRKLYVALEENGVRTCSEAARSCSRRLPRAEASLTPRSGLELVVEVDVVARRDHRVGYSLWKSCISFSERRQLCPS